MKVIDRIGIRVCRSFCAVMMGPTALVRKCFEKSSKELVRSAYSSDNRLSRSIQLSGSLDWSEGNFQVMGKAQSH